MVSKIEEIKEKISIYFSERKDIQFSYLFGSRVKNQSGKLSDIDIAVYLSEALSSDKRADLRLDLINRLCSLIKTDRIDLIVLNDSPLLLSFQVVHDGLILYSKDEIKRIEFETRIMSLYFGQQYYYRRHAQESIDRIAVEGIL